MVNIVLNMLLLPGVELLGGYAVAIGRCSGNAGRYHALTGCSVVVVQGNNTVEDAGGEDAVVGALPRVCGVMICLYIKRKG